MHIDIERAQDYIKANQLDYALKTYMAIEQLNLSEEEQFTISADVGFILYEIGHVQESIHYLQQALTIEYADNGKVNKMLGYAYKLLNNNEMAVEHLEEAVHLIENETENSICKFELARLLMILEDFALAEKYFKELLISFKQSKNDYYGSTLYYLGQIQILFRTVDIADEYFNELVQLESANHKAHAYFGKLFIANFKQNGDEMLDYASKVMSLLPDFYEIETVTYFTVKSYQYLNDQAKYKAALQQFIDRYPDGKYKTEYDLLKNHVFKLTEI